MEGPPSEPERSTAISCDNDRDLVCDDIGMDSESIIGLVLAYK